MCHRGAAECSCDSRVEWVMHNLPIHSKDLNSSFPVLVLIVLDSFSAFYNPVSLTLMAVPAGFGYFCRLCSVLLLCAGFRRWRWRLPFGNHSYSYGYLCIQSSSRAALWRQRRLFPPWVAGCWEPRNLYNWCSSHSWRFNYSYILHRSGYCRAWTMFPWLHHLVISGLSLGLTCHLADSSIAEAV